MPARSLTPEVVRRQAAIGELAVAPDGTLVAYTRRTVQGDRDVIHLWLVPYAGGAPRRLTSGRQRDTRPRFSPDGRHLGFLSDREGERAQVHVLPLAGGEAWRLTDFARGVSDFDWAPDGRTVVALAAEERSPFQAGERDKGEPTARVIRRIDWRYDGEGLVLHPSHLHLVALRAPGERGSARRLTSGLWSAERPRFAPDGESVAFLADPRPDADVLPLPAVHRVPAAGGEIERVTDLPGPVVRFAWEPDGALVCLAHDVERPADHDSPLVWRVDRDGRARRLWDGLDRWIGDTGTGTDLNDWHATFDDAGRVTTVSFDGAIVPHLFADDGPRALVDPALGPMANALARGGEAIAAVMTLGPAPAEVYALADGGAPRPLTRHGGGWLRRHRAPRVEAVEAPGPAGPVQMFLVHPSGVAPHATVLDVHGGPTGAWGPAPPLEALLLAEAGYLVALPNIRGSNNRGRDWTAALQSRWGEVDAEDCHAVLDHLVGAGLADPARLGALGLSYGGFMVNWLVGTSDRFAAAVSENGVTNQVSSWANCDLGAAYDYAAGLGEATTPEGIESLWRMSPLRHVAAIRTPLLLLQGERDMRCPPADAEQLFVALRWLGRTVEYVLYPEEPHALQGTGRPDRRRDRHERVLGWFGQHMTAGAV
jgi:dipeptidyl aminopeptidase/acylaminoacyl peptidase